MLEHARPVGRDGRMQPGPRLWLNGRNRWQHWAVWRLLLHARLKWQAGWMLRRRPSSTATAEVLLLELRREARRSIPCAHRSINTQALLIPGLTG